MANKKSIRVPENLFVRDLDLEAKFGIKEIKLYGYWEDSSSLTIVGQLFAPRIEKEFLLNCSIYDKDGDVIESCENDAYGSGLVNSYIQPEAFFDGFPFRFNIYGPQKSKIKEIKILPSEDC